MKRITLLVFLLVAGIHISCNHETVIKKEVFDKIDLGMTKPEVKIILGEPSFIRFSIDSFENHYYRVQHRKGDIRNAEVSFDKKGFVHFFSAGLPS